MVNFATIRSHHAFSYMIAILAVLVFMLPLLPHDHSAMLTQPPLITKMHSKQDFVGIINSLKTKLFGKQMVSFLFHLFPSILLYLTLVRTWRLYPCILLLIRRLYLFPIKFTSTYVSFASKYKSRYISSSTHIY